MKKFLTIILMLTSFSTQALAEKSCSENTEKVVKEEVREIKTDVPKFLEGATITVRLKDGTESVVSAKKFKVVPRVQQFVVSKVETEKTLVCSTGDKNRISILAGKGPTGRLNANLSNQPASATVETEIDAVGGIQYQRMLNDYLSIGIQGQTNNTGSVMIGVDF